MGQGSIDYSEDGRQRVVITGVSPEIDSGGCPIKRVIGENVSVEADIFSDGHEVISAVMKFRHESQPDWSTTQMVPMLNDRWKAAFVPARLGTYYYTFEAWVNPFATWQRDLKAKFGAGQDVSLELITGANFMQRAAERANGQAQVELKSVAELVSSGNPAPMAVKAAGALDANLARLFDAHSEHLHATRYTRELRVSVDPLVARFSAWYELFPRSCAPESGRHGNFKDCEALLPRISAMGFDVVYLPPIHPIGSTFRKGKNNQLAAGPGEPGSPWAIGNVAGGHKSVHPELGSLEDFQALVRKARSLNLEIALDIAFQCSPDHPYVTKHPEWFRRGAAGSIQYAENPPKKYQDIYPLNFECDDWQALWAELKSVFEFWLEQGVRVFRVDNPHTKPFRFWEWCIGSLKAERPELIFLSEAFTRQKPMAQLAKLGFTQSYNYFPWRNTKHELTTYLTELTQTDLRQYFRPNLWPNTPDIQPEYLQFGGKAAFKGRLVLAATLSSSYGIYGPPFEFCENQAREPGSEEYLNSEKYEIRNWNFSAATPLSDLISRINGIRRDHLSLQSNETLRFHEVDNEQIIAYSKNAWDLQEIVLIIVNLDPHHTQQGWVGLPLEEWGISPRDTYQCHDLLTGARYLWTGSRNFVELNPDAIPAHVFRLRRYSRTEHDFDYFL